MRFLDDYTIISNIEGSECIFTRSAEGNKLMMYVDSPEDYYMDTIYLECDLTPEEFEEYFYFKALLKYKRFKSSRI